MGYRVVVSTICAKLLSYLEIKYTVRDERELGAPLLVSFQGELSDSLLSIILAEKW